MSHLKRAADGDIMGFMDDVMGKQPMLIHSKMGMDQNLYHTRFRGDEHPCIPDFFFWCSPGLG